MASFTNFLKLLKKNPATDGKDTFNIETMLNENWDKIDKKVEENSSAIGQLSNTRGYSNIPIITTDILLKNTNGWCRGINIPNAPIQNTWVFYRTVIMGDSFPWGYGFVRAYDYENKKEYINYKMTSGWEGWREIPTVNNISNPNLVINPDFRINQRGQAEYTFNVNSGCSVDRWVADPNFGIIKVIPNDGFLRLEQISIGTGSGFHAVKETIESSKNLSGKKVTLSCEYRNKAGSSQGMILIVSGNGVISQKLLPHSENWTKAQLTVELPQLTSDIAVWIYSDISKSLGYTDYRYVKLELGEIATPLSPRPYGEELTLCQRYCSGKDLIGIPYAITTSYIWFFVPLTQTPRSTPTLIGQPVVQVNGVTQSGFTFSDVKLANNGVYLPVQKSNHGLTIGNGLNLYTLTAIFDAEIY